MSSPQSTDHLPARLWGVLIGLTLVWGFNWTAMKVAITEVGPFTFRTLCLLVGAALLFGYLRGTRQVLTIPRAHWPRLVLLSFFIITCWNILVVFGLKQIPSGRAAILAYTMPAWAIPLSVWILGERLTPRRLLGLALGLGGMALLMWDEFARLSGAPVGALMVLAAAITWAIGTVLQKKYPVNAPLAAYTAWIMLIGGVPIYLGLLLFEDPRHLMGVSSLAALAVAYNVLFSFAWGHWAVNKLALTVSVTVFALSMLPIPVVGVLSGMLFLGERPGWLEFAALALVLGSLASVISPSKPK